MWAVGYRDVRCVPPIYIYGLPRAPLGQLTYTMSSILAYQKERYTSSPLGEEIHHIAAYTAQKAAAQASPLGELNPLTGSLKIKISIETIIKRYKVWTDFSPNAH